MRRLEYEPNNYDDLLAAYSLIHIPSKDIAKTLGGFFRVLKPGGAMLVIVQKGEADKIVDEPPKERRKNIC